MKQDAHRNSFLFYSKAVSFLFVCAGLVIVIIALLLVPETAEKTRIRIHQKKLFPSWFPVCWKTELRNEGGHLLCTPLQGGAAWGGFRFQRKRKDRKTDYLRPVIDALWKKRGALCFDVRGSTDFAGIVHPPPELQFFFFTSPEQKTGHPIRLRPWHLASAEQTADENWKHATVPLTLFDFKKKFPLFAVAFQAAGELTAPFAVKNITIELKPEAVLDTFTRPDPGTAVFPALVELSEAFLPGRDQRLSIEKGTIFSGGTAQFLLGAQLNYDMKLDVWGESLKAPDKSGEAWDGYEPPLAWLYETIPDYAQLARCGLNCWCVSAPPEPFLNRYLEETLPGREAYSAGCIKELSERITLPLSVDFSAYPGTLGFFKKAALGKAITYTFKTAAPPVIELKEKPPETAFSPEGSHFMPFSLLPEGQALALRYFRETAAFLQKKKVPVFMFELFNEPAYIPAFHGKNTPVFVKHRTLFARYLKKNYPDGTRFRHSAHLDPGTENPYRAATEKNAREHLFLWKALCTHISTLFNDLLKQAMETVTSTYTEGKPLFSVQLNRWDVCRGTPLVQPEKLFEILPVITAPTDGGNFTRGVVAEKKPERAVKSPIAPAPLTADLLQSFSRGEKPVLDQEFSCPGTAAALKRKLWTRILLGFDGVLLFSWSKRAWQWHTKKEGKKLAERYPFPLLNPFAHPPSELAAISRFRQELLPFQKHLLPKPFGIEPVVGVLHSYANERAYDVMHTPQREGRTAYAALRYSTIPLRMITGEQLHENNATLNGLKALFVCGISVLEKETFTALKRYAEKGGTVFLLNAPLSYTAEGEKRSHKALSGGASLGEKDKKTVTLKDLPEAGLPGELSGVAFRVLLPGDATRTVVKDTHGNPRVVVYTHQSGGNVYTISFSSTTYTLLRLLLSLLESENITAPWSLVSAETGERTVNVLLSVRDRGATKIVLFANQDRYAKKVRFQWKGLSGSWKAQVYLEGPPGKPHSFAPQKGAVFTIPAEGVKLLHLTGAAD